MALTPAERERAETNRQNALVLQLRRKFAANKIKRNFQHALKAKTYWKKDFVRGGRSRANGKLFVSPAVWLRRQGMTEKVKLAKGKVWPRNINTLTWDRRDIPSTSGQWLKWLTSHQAPRPQRQRPRQLQQQYMQQYLQRPVPPNRPTRPNNYRINNPYNKRKQDPIDNFMENYDFSQAPAPVSTAIIPYTSQTRAPSPMDVDPWGPPRQYNIDNRPMYSGVALPRQTVKNTYRTASPYNRKDDIDHFMENYEFPIRKMPNQNRPRSVDPIDNYMRNYKFEEPSVAHHYTSTYNPGRSRVLTTRPRSVSAGTIARALGVTTDQIQNFAQDNDLNIHHLNARFQDNPISLGAFAQRHAGDFKRSYYQRKRKLANGGYRNINHGVTPMFNRKPPPSTPSPKTTTGKRLGPYDGPARRTRSKTAITEFIPYIVPRQPVRTLPKRIKPRQRTMTNEQFSTAFGINKAGAYRAINHNSKNKSYFDAARKIQTRARGFTARSIYNKRTRRVATPDVSLDFRPISQAPTPTSRASSTISDRLTPVYNRNSPIEFGSALQPTTRYERPNGRYVAINRSERPSARWPTYPRRVTTKNFSKNLGLRGLGKSMTKPFTKYAMRGKL
jgi:hypothetical protein